MKGAGGGAKTQGNDAVKKDACTKYRDLEIRITGHRCKCFTTGAAAAVCLMKSPPKLNPQQSNLLTRKTCSLYIMTSK